MWLKSKYEIFLGVRTLSGHPFSVIVFFGVSSHRYDLGQEMKSFTGQQKLDFCQLIKI